MKPNIALKWALIFGTALAALPASADDERLPLGVMLHAGRSNITGDLSKSEPASTWGLGLQFGMNEKPTSDSLGGTQGFFLLDFTTTSTTSKTDTKFQFNPDKSLLLSETSILPIICALANYPIQACVGVGLMEVRVNDEDNMQNYGAFRWDARVGHYLDRGLIGGIEVHYYDVKQKVNKKDSNFAALSYQAGLGWSW
jgi:hypothetical protein